MPFSPSFFTASRRRWALLIALSAVLAAALKALDFPAALLLGPLIAGVIVALSGDAPRLGRTSFQMAQSIVGCLIARNMPLDAFANIGGHWPMLVSGVLFVIIAAAALGLAQSIWGSLPGTTALWGASPGGAAATVLMSEAYGADMRLVAVMQYLRVASVAVTASIIAHLWAPEGVQMVATIWFPPISWTAFALTLAVAGISLLVAIRFKVPAGPLLVPMAASLALSDAGLLQITLPPWFLAVVYTMIGWNIGLRFTHAVVRQALRALPAIMASTLTLIAVCAAFGMLMVYVMGIDPMTAYLATSPGGADSIAIIAAASHVDMPLVMLMQTSRLICVIILVPPLTRYLAARLARRAAAPPT